MPTIAGLARASILTAIAALAFLTVGAQNGHSDAILPGPPDAAKILKSAADAMGMPRNGAEGGGALPEIDVINRMQFWGSGTGSSAGQSYKTNYHAAVSYNPPAMRVEMTRTDGASP